MKKRLARFGLALLLAAPLGACALADVGSGPAPQLFMLTSSHPVPPADASLGIQLQVDEFTAPAVIDTTRIVFQSGPNEIKYYADARWGDNAPKMIQALAIETLQNSGRFASVSASGANLDSDYMLMGDIRQFAAEAGEDAKSGNTNVRVDLFLRLVRVEDHKIVASRNFNTIIPVAGSSIGSVVAAYDAALHTTLDGITLWTLQELAKAAKPNA
jgi:cholesterol transport system auxiliary component